MPRADHNIIKNLIFDWSGVISDDVTLVWKSYNRLFEYYGKDTMTLEKFRDTFVLPYTIFWDKYFPGKPREDLITKFNQ